MAGSIGVHRDLASQEFWDLPPEERHAEFARLRKVERPIFVEEKKIPLLRSGEGFYAYVRHAEVYEAFRNAAIFSSEPSVSQPLPPPWAKYIFGNSIVNMDDPRHARLRKIVSRAFTPKMLTAMQDKVEASAAEIVDDVLAAGRTGEFQSMVATRLAVQVVCDIIGIPDTHRPAVLSRVHTWADYTGARAGFSLPLAVKNTYGLRALRGLVIKLGRRRRANPTGDVITKLVTADVDGEALTPTELGAFFILLVAAGINTASNAMTHALKLFTDNPEQRRILLDDIDGRMGPAIEEIVRYVTPGMLTGRTVKADTELGGQPLRAGDRIVLYINSANRDEAVFERPDEFDITRDPNPHVAFGGPGPHFCLGANLVRKELGVMLKELFTRLPEIRAVGEPVRLRSNFENGIKRLDYEY